MYSRILSLYIHLPLLNRVSGIYFTLKQNYNEGRSLAMLLYFGCVTLKLVFEKRGILSDNAPFAETFFFFFQQQEQASDQFLRSVATLLQMPNISQEYKVVLPGSAMKIARQTGEKAGKLLLKRDIKISSYFI